MDCGGSYTQARESLRAFLLLKGNHGEVVWRGKVSEAKRTGPRVRAASHQIWTVLVPIPSKLQLEFCDVCKATENLDLYKQVTFCLYPENYHWETVIKKLCTVLGPLATQGPLQTDLFRVGISLQICTATLALPSPPSVTSLPGPLPREISLVPAEIKSSFHKNPLYFCFIIPISQVTVPDLPRSILNLFSLPPPGQLLGFKVF